MRKQRALPAIELSARLPAHPQDARKKAAVFLPEPGSSSAALRLKWLASTCLAGTVALGVIGIAIYASMNIDDRDGAITAIWEGGLAPTPPSQAVVSANEAEQSSAGAKADRIQTSALGFATRHIIHDRLVLKRGSREYITIKPYARIVARLGTAQPDESEPIPPFNPFKLYMNTSPLGQDGGGKAGNKGIAIKLIDLPGGNVPREDKIELSNAQALEFVARASETYADAETPLAVRTASEQGIARVAVQQVAYHPGEAEFATEAVERIDNTTTMNKSGEDEALADGSETKAVTVAPGDSLQSIVVAAGGDGAQAQAIADAMSSVLPVSAIKPGLEVRLTMVPAPSDSGQMEPLKVSVFSGEKHQVTIARDGEGDYVASDDPIDLAAAADLRPQQYPQRASLYTSFYHSALSQNLPPDVIENLIRVHSYEVDFKQRVKPGDSLEIFVDMQEGEDGREIGPGEVLYTAIMVDGTPRRFWRYRSPDGIVDFYDENGNSAKKFLTRNPVRGGRYTSGFGVRRHPVFGGRRMHTGVDWAAPPGTPIVAGGDGLVESVGRYGGYGNYVRIHHANGFSTAYGHMARYAPGLVPGLTVKQGQVIGFVGSTGSSTGPHCHYEVLVNNRQVNPMTIHVPRGAQLAERQLAEFQKERRRIDGLMTLTPVTSRVAAMTPTPSQTP